MKTYAITGGTGKTGKALSLELLNKNNNVRVICRNQENAKDLQDNGAEIFIGDTRDEVFLKSAFSNCDAVYVLLPIDLQATDYTAMQVTHATAIRNAVVDANVKYALTLSSVGAHLDTGNGVVLGLHKMEELFNEVPDLNVLHLRASYFMENTFRQIPVIKQSGKMAGLEDGNVKFAIVAAEDIAARAVKHLESLDFSGKSIDYVLGERDVSYNEIAEIYGRAIGISDLKYVQLSENEFTSGMLNMGASKSATSKFCEFTRLINEGKVTDFYKRTAENTSPTSIEEFSKIFKKKFETKE